MLNLYLLRLRRILHTLIANNDADEITSEVKNHLSERTEELQASGLNNIDAEIQAVGEFGHVCELAVELTKGYPPKLPTQVRWLNWLPEIGLATILALAAFAFFLLRGASGLATAIVILIPTLPMFIIPSLSTGMSRLRYRQIRLFAFQTRMANYGLALSAASTIGLIGLQNFGSAGLGGIFPLLYAFNLATILMYFVMRVSLSEAKVLRSLRHRLRPR